MGCEFMLNLQLSRIISIAALSSALWVCDAQAEETCWTEGPTQFADGVQYCVSSVLPSQGKWNYGPKNLVGYYGSVGAWCEGVEGPGIGETISLRIDGGPAFRQLSIRNGYNKSQTSFANNGRVKRMRITSDIGIDTTVTLEDKMGAQIIPLPKVAQHQWLKLEILDVYPGKKLADTCIDDLGPDFAHEEELLQQRQLSPEACLPSGKTVSGRLEIHEETHPAGYPMRSFHLIPPRPLCVVAGDEKLEGVQRIQLAPVSDQQTQELKESTGRTITVNGNFYTPHTAWHTGDVLLSDLKIVAKAAAPEVPSTTKVAKPRDVASILENDTNRGGMDIRSLDLPAAEPELCQIECANDPRCKAFTYVKPGIQGPSARCWLKHGVPQARKNTCCVSGLKTGGISAQSPTPEASTVPAAGSPTATSESAAADLSLVQQEVVSQHGWPQTFTLLFYAGDDNGSAVRQETWNYHSAKLSFTFLDGALARALSE